MYIGQSDGENGAGASFDSAALAAGRHASASRRAATPRSLHGVRGKITAVLLGWLLVSGEPVTE